MGIQFLMAIILCAFSISCQGPLEGEIIEFTTPNEFKELPPEATRIVMKTKENNWRYEYVQYNDTIVNISTGRIAKINHDGDIIDPTFSYDTKMVENKWITEIAGSFFNITSESSKNNIEPVVITVDITENTSKEKRVLLVQLINLDTGSFFRIEQNPK